MTGADAIAGGGMLDCWFWETNIKMRSSEDCMPIIWLCMTCSDGPMHAFSN